MGDVRILKRSSPAQREHPKPGVIQPRLPPDGMNEGRAGPTHPPMKRLSSPGTRSKPIAGQGDASGRISRRLSFSGWSAGADLLGPVSSSSAVSDVSVRHLVQKDQAPASLVPSVPGGRPASVVGLTA